MAAVLVRGESSQGELLVELVNAPGATRRVRRPQVGLKAHRDYVWLAKGSKARCQAKTMDCAPSHTR